MITTTLDNQEEKVKEGIDFLLSHFTGRQRLFPRKMATLASQGKQFTIYNKEQILDACIKSNFRDCRLNAYPVLEEGLLQTPNVIFIDLDLQTNLKELKRNLEKTLRIIKQKLNGFIPTVLFTGNGYHIYIVLDVRPLELIEELRELSNEPSKQFLRFAEYTFTKYKNYGNTSDRKKYLDFINVCKSELCVNWVIIEGLTEENIKKWIEITRNKILLDIHIRTIWQKTSGLPVLLEPWINLSKNLDPKEIDITNFCSSIISQYFDIDSSLFNKINKLSLLKYPHPIDLIINYLNMKDHDEYSIFLVDVFRYGIFDKTKEWFRNEVIQNCFKNFLGNPQRKRFHKEIVKYYDECIIKYDMISSQEKLKYFEEYAYHLHYGEYDSSLSTNRKVALEMIIAGNLSIAEECLKRSIIDSEKANDEKEKMSSLFLISSKILIVNGEFDEAEKNFNLLLIYYEKIHDKRMQCSILNFLGRIFRARGRYHEALLKHEKSWKIARSIESYEDEATALNNMGIVNKHIYELGTALKNFEESLSIAKKIDDNRKIYDNLLNIGILYDIIGEALYNLKKYNLASEIFDDALKIYQDCYNFDEKLNYPMGMSKVKNNIGLIYFHKKEYDLAVKYIQESMEIKEEIGHYEGIYNCIYNIGLIYSDKEDNRNALIFFEKALNMAIHIGNQQEIDKVKYEIDKIRSKE